MSDESKDAIQQLMNDAAPAIVAFADKAQTMGDLAESVIVVRREHAGVIVVGICDRAQLAANPTPDLIPQQIAVLRNRPKADEILLLVFTQHHRGVGRITKQQIDEQLAKTANEAN